MDAECIKAADEMDMVFCHTTLRLVGHGIYPRSIEDEADKVVPPLVV
jgi:hypothetical protein